MLQRLLTFARRVAFSGRPPRIHAHSGVGAIQTRTTTGPAARQRKILTLSHISLPRLRPAGAFATGLYGNLLPPPSGCSHPCSASLNHWGRAAKQLMPSLTLFSLLSYCTPISLALGMRDVKVQNVNDCCRALKSQGWRPFPSDRLVPDPIDSCLAGPRSQVPPQTIYDPCWLALVSTAMFRHLRCWYAASVSIMTLAVKDGMFWPC